MLIYVVGDSVNIKRGRVGILLTSLTLPHFYACPKPGLGFPMSYDMVPPILSSWS
jgi:hypothetical protein